MHKHPVQRPQSTAPPYRSVCLIHALKQQPQPESKKKKRGGVKKKKREKIIESGREVAAHRNAAGHHAGPSRPSFLRRRESLCRSALRSMGCLWEGAAHPRIRPVGVDNRAIVQRNPTAHAHRGHARPCPSSPAAHNALKHPQDDHRPPTHTAGPSVARHCAAPTPRPKHCGGPDLQAAAAQARPERTLPPLLLCCCFFSHVAVSCGRPVQRCTAHAGGNRGTHSVPQAAAGKRCPAALARGGPRPRLPETARACAANQAGPRPARKVKMPRWGKSAPCRPTPHTSAAVQSPAPPAPPAAAETCGRVFTQSGMQMGCTV